MNAERYIRQTVLPEFGKEGQEKLLNSKVAVIGAGGLGVPVLQYLTGMGLGHITIVDADTVDISNIHRQVIYSERDISRKKVDVAKDVLSKLNPEIVLEVMSKMLTRDNSLNIIDGHDLVVDCTDSIEARYIINDACVQLKLPFVYGSLHRFEGHVSVFNFQGGLNYRDIYPDDSVRVDNCNEIGVLGVLPGMIGTYQAMEVVKILTGIGEPLKGKLLVIDALRSEHHVFELAKVESRNNPSLKENSISWKELDDYSLEDYHFLDVREPGDFEKGHDSRFENIPMSSIADFNPMNRPVVLTCNQGRTTETAMTILKSKFPNLIVKQLDGGYSSL